MRARLTTALAGCALLCAAGGAGVSTAYFNDSSAARGSSAVGGSLSIGLSGLGGTSSVFAAGSEIRSNGPELTQTVTLTNTGTVPGIASVATQSATDSSSPGPSSSLTLDLECITNCTGVTDPAPVALTSTAPIALGRMAPGATRQWRVHLSWGASSDSTSVAGKTSTFKLLWQLRTP